MVLQHEISEFVKISMLLFMNHEFKVVSLFKRLIHIMLSKITCISYFCPATTGTCGVVFWVSFFLHIMHASGLNQGSHEGDNILALLYGK